MSNTEPPVYTVDEETKQYLMDGLNWILTFADSQIDDDAGLKIQAVAEELAIRFDLPVQKIEIVQDEDGDWNVKIDGAKEELDERKRPVLSVIDGGKEEDSED